MRSCLCLTLDLQPVEDVRCHGVSLQLTGAQALHTFQDQGAEEGRQVRGQGSGVTGSGEGQGAKDIVSWSVS